LKTAILTFEVAWAGHVQRMTNPHKIFLPLSPWSNGWMCPRNLILGRAWPTC